MAELTETLRNSVGEEEEEEADPGTQPANAGTAADLTTEFLELGKPDTVGKEGKGGSFIVGDLLGKGTFGLVFKGKRAENGYPVAIKFEKVRPEKRCQLWGEQRTYNQLGGKRLGFTNVYWVDLVMERKFVAMVMDLHGPNLETIKEQYGSLSLKTVLTLGVQLVQTLDDIHGKGIVHRDIKPGNIVVGRQDPRRVYIIDFGLSANQRGPVRPAVYNKQFCGTVKYASLNALKGVEQTYRDDMESLCYTLLHLLNSGPALPWQKVRGSPSQKVEKIKKMKASLTLEEICEGAPVEFVEYLKHCRQLKFGQKPNYDQLRNFFFKAFAAAGFNWDLRFEWY